MHMKYCVQKLLGLVGILLPNSADFILLFECAKPQHCSKNSTKSPEKGYSLFSTSPTLYFALTRGDQFH